ncbi:hypothetical protein NX059_008949 [Plenodomus lindquistii]|nr:hypothetical protein NX059_008949 [Plenodomus lindquistii]
MATQGIPEEHPLARKGVSHPQEPGDAFTGYFRGALSSNNFEEGKTKTVILHDVEPFTFEAFSDWVYMQQLPNCFCWDNRYDASEGPSIDKVLILVYIFADRFIVPKLKEAILPILITSAEYGGLHFDAVIAVFQDLRDDEPVLRMLVDAHCLYFGTESYATELEHFRKLPAEFLRRIAFQYASERHAILKALSLSDYMESTDETTMINEEVEEHE